MPMYYECGKLYVLAFLHTSTFGSVLGYGVVVVAHIHLAVTGQRQTLTVGRSAPFSFHWLLHAWRNSHLPRSLHRSNVSVNFFEFSPTEFAVCSKPPSRNAHQVSYLGGNWTQIMQSGSSLKQHLFPFGHAAYLAGSGMSKTVERRVRSARVLRPGNFEKKRSDLGCPNGFKHLFQPSTLKHWRTEFR